METLTFNVKFDILSFVIKKDLRFFAALAQLVEHHHGKVGVAGSSPAGGFT